MAVAGAGAEAEVVGDSDVEVESEAEAEVESEAEVEEKIEVEVEVETKVEAEADPEVEVEAEAEVVVSFALFSPQRGVFGGSNSRADRSVRLSFRFSCRSPRVTEARTIQRSALPFPRGRFQNRRSLR